MKRFSPDGNLRCILRNLPYLPATKVLLLLLIAALTLAAGGQFFEGCRLYTDDRDGVRNALTQGAQFNLKESVPFSTELKKTARNILLYALKYQDIDGFAASGSLGAQLQQEEKNRDSQIAATLSICEWQIRSGEITQENLDNGFIVRGADGTFRTDKKAIAAHYTAVYDELMEGEKRVMDRDYREVMTALEDLRGVYYAVVDYTADRLVTNTGCTRADELQRFFSGTQNNLIVLGAEDPVFPADTMDEFVPLVLEAAGAGDPAALEVLRYNAACLRELLAGMCCAFGGTECPVVLAGRLLEGGSLYYRLLKEQCAGLPLRLILPALPPVFGAARLAAEAAGSPEDPDFERRFAATFSLK